MIGETELKLATWVADKLFVMMDKEHSRSESCRVRVAGYCQEIGQCLESLASEFTRSDRDPLKDIPRIHGHKLEMLIRGFEFVVASNLVGSGALPRNDGKGLLEELESSLRAAKELDYPIKNYSDLSVLGGSEADLVAHLQRTAGNFLGLSSLILSAGPFKPLNTSNGKDLPHNRKGATR